MYRLKLLAVLLVLAVFWCTGPVFAQLETAGASDFKGGATSDPTDSTIPSTAMEIGYDDLGNPIYQECTSCPPQYKPVFENFDLKDSVFVCFGTTIYDTLVVTDENTDQIITVTLEDGPGIFMSTPSLSPVTSYYEFTPDTSGIHEVTFKAVDDKGYSAYAVKKYFVFLNHPPTITNGGAVISSDQTGVELTYDVDAVDGEDDPITYEIISGPGTIDPVTGLISFTPQSEGTYTVTVEVADSCGTDLTNITFEVTSTSSDLVCPDSYIEEFICEPTTLCYPIEGVPAGAVVTVDPPSAWWDAEQGTVCFYTNCSVEKNLTVAISSGDKATPPTGADTCQFTVNVTLNSPPTVILPGDTTVSSCDPQEICVPVGIGDINDNIASIDISPAGAVYNDISGNVCFTPEVAGPVELIVTVTDECGAVKADTMAIDVDLDTPPVVSAGEDFTANLCALSEICFPVSISGDDIADITVSPTGTYDAQNEEICFTPGDEGTTQLILTAVDDCGNAAADTINVTVVLDPTVSVTCPEPGYQLICEPTEICVDLSVVPSDAIVETSYGTYRNGQLCFTADTAGTYTIDVSATSDCGTDQCTVEYVVELGEQPEITCPTEPLDFEICEGEEICIDLPVFPASASVEVDGAEYVDGQICFTPQSPGTYEINVAASTECGTANCTITANVGFGDIPQIACPAEPVYRFLCEPGEICYQLDISPLNAVVSSSFGTINNGQLCFMADTAGTYNIDISAETDCGTETCTVSFVVDFGESPAIECPAEPITENLCTPGDICLDLPIMPLDAEVTASYGSYADGQICFYADTSGTYEITVDAVTECGTESCAISVNVNIEEAPAITCPVEPINKFLCEPGQICYQLEILPDYANVTTSFGSITDGQLCFIADTAGTYNIDVTAETNCGTETCTISFVVEFGEIPAISCPTEPFNIDLCDPGDICLDLPIMPLDAEVTASYGSYADGQICFYADTSGTYEITVEAVTECGTESCAISVNVNIEEAPSITCPVEPISEFLCEPGEICYQLEILPDYASVTTSFGNITDGQLCFMADTAGTYNIDVTAETNCGTETCTISFVVEFGETPAIECPAEPFTYQICEPTEFCIDLPVTPVDAEMTTSYGTIANGQLCFTADTAGTYEITVTAATKCGTDECVVTAIVTQGDYPEISCPVEPINKFICEPQEICYQLDIFPIDASVSTSFGSYAYGQLCFMADTSGIYNIEITAETDCGSANCTIQFVVDIGNPPVIECPLEPLTYTICEPGQICVPLAISPNASVETSFGSYADGQLCFDADTSGAYSISVSASNDCGQDDCAITAVVNIEDPATIECPAEPVEVNLCEPSQYCYQLDISPVYAEITASYGTITDGELCFDADTSGTYEIEVTAATSCGTDVCTISFDVNIGEAPVISCPLDPVDVQLCGPQQFCYDLPIEPVDAEITVEGGTYSNGQICFDAVQSGQHIVTISASNDCGTDQCTITFDVTIGEAPEITCPSEPFEFTLCEPTEFCIDLPIVPVNADISTSFGSYNNGQLCFNADTSGTYVIVVTASTICGEDQCQITVNVTEGSAPELVCPNDTSVFICSPDTICIPIEGINPGDQVEVSPASAWYDGEKQSLCFYTNCTVQKDLAITVATDCGTASCSFVVDVTMNSNPLAFLGPDITVNSCGPEEICIPAAIDDPDDNIYLTEVSPLGTYNHISGNICFTPDTAGLYTLVLKATDECAAFDSDTVTVQVNFNDGPTVTSPHNYEDLLCDISEVCFPVSIEDGQGNIEAIDVNFGHYNMQTGEVCFTPDTAGIYGIIIGATDSCGLSDYDTTQVTISYGEAAAITCPAEPIDYFICEPTTLCYDLTVVPSDAEVTVSYGTFIDGQLCFDADTTGTYQIDVTASSDCGDDYCTITFDVVRGETPAIDCPSEPITKLICEPQEICQDLAVDPESAVVTSSFGNYADGQLCFIADTSGFYEITVTAETECGTATCEIAFDVEIGAQPEITCPANETVFLCEAEEICRDIAISPQDAEITVSPLGVYRDGQICFVPDTAGSYDITVTAATDCGQTECTFTIDVILNSAPTVDAGGDTEFFQCEFSEICLPITTADVDENIASVSASYGNYNSETSEVCFIPDTVGVYCIEVTVTDECGLEAKDIVCATVTSGDVAVIECPGEPVTKVLCEPGEICVPIGITPATAEITVSYGSYADGEICFVADTAGTYTIDIGAADACGSDECQLTVYVSFGSVAEITCPDLPIAVSLCDPGDISITLPITPSNATVTVDPIGSYDSSTGRLTFVADTAGTYVITVDASAPCGSAQCQVTVNVFLEDSPVITCPEPVNAQLCVAITDDLCFDVDISGSNLDVTVLPEGSYSGGEVCIPVTEAGEFTYKIIAENICGADTCDVPVTIEGNQPPVLTVPNDILIPSCTDDLTEICVDGIFASDPEGDQLTITETCGPGSYIEVEPDSGKICFTPESNDITYEFCMEVSDGCQSVSQTFNVTIYPSNVCETCVGVSLQTDSCYVVGSIVPIKVMTTAIEQIGGFDLLISYDASVLAFVSAIQGDAIPDWEYFTYSNESGSCGGACPSGLLRLVAIADRANGPYHPPTEQLSPDGAIAVINLRITHDQNVGGQFLPVNFFWLDCGDNGFSDPTGNSLYIDAIVYDPFGSVIWDEADDDLFPESNRLPYTGAPDSCLSGDKVTPIRCVEFHNGGICVTHPDDIDDRGDLNLNAVAYEIADAVVFTNYFIHGFAAFQVNVAGQTAASDVNADGTPLTVADLVYLIRVITGDAPPNPKIAPDNALVKLMPKRTGSSLNIEAELNYPVGAGLMIFDYDGVTPVKPELDGLPDGMNMIYSIDKNEIRVLIYSFEKNTKVDIGKGELLNIGFSGEGEIDLREAEFASYSAEELPAVITSKLLPTEFRLSQNYPNPFNPSTTIEFTLPASCHWCLSIYNMNGQVVKKYEGDADPGISSVVWDGTGFDGQTVATGIYLYKMDAAGYSDTRKMIMLK